MAASYWPFLKAPTPLLRRSRAFSLLQPETPTARRRRAAEATPRRKLRADRQPAVLASVTDEFIEASIPAERQAKGGLALRYSRPPCEGQKAQNSEIVSQLLRQQPDG